MNQRGISTLAAAVGAALLGLATATFLMDWVVIDVTVPEDDVHFVAPLPLIVADIALAFVPDEAMEDAEIPPELRAQKDAILNGLDELLKLDDHALVSVSTPEENVEIRVVDGELLVSVDAEDARVRCTLPLEGIRDSLDRWDWTTVDPQMALDMLHAAHRGPLVDVQAEDGVHVKIDMW